MIKSFIIFFITLTCIQSFSQNQDIEKDVNYYTDLIKADPSADNFYFRGYTKYNLSDYDGAMEDYNKAIALEPGNFEAHFSRAFYMKN